MRRCAIALLLLLPLAAVAQRDDLLSRSELVVAGGGMNYLGDLNDQSAFGEVHAAFGVGVRCRLDNRWSLRFGGAYGGISASEDCIAKRYMTFRSRIYEGSLVAEFNFRPYGPGATEGRCSISAPRHNTPLLTGRRRGWRCSRCALRARGQRCIQSVVPIR